MEAASGKKDFHINSQQQQKEQQQIKATPLPYNTIKASHMEGNKEKISSFKY